MTLDNGTRITSFIHTDNKQLAIVIIGVQKSIIIHHEVQERTS